MIDFDYTPDTLRLQCMCSGTCTVAVVAIAEGDDEDPAFSDVSFYEHVCAGPSLRRRARTAWAVLRGRDPYTHGLLLTMEESHELGLFLVRKSTSRLRPAPVVGPPRARLGENLGETRPDAP